MYLFVSQFVFSQSKKELNQVFTLWFLFVVISREGCGLTDNCVLLSAGAKKKGTVISL